MADPTLGFVLYHGTSSKAVDSILREGLMPRRGQGNDDIPFLVSLWCAPKWETPMVFFVRQPHNSIGYAQCTCTVAGGYPVTLEVRIPNDCFQKFIYADWGCRFEGAIPPEWIFRYDPNEDPEGFIRLPGFP